MRNIRKGTNPISLPFLLRSSERPLAEWAFKVVACLQQIRDRIDQSYGGSGGGIGGGVSRYVPWKPTFRVQEDVHEVKFNLGLLDQVAADNWDSWIGIDPEATVWPVLDVTASDGKITGFSLALDTETPTESQIQENHPPGSFKVILGCIYNLTPLMTVDDNLEAFGMEVFRTSKTSPTEGEEAFNRWWKWSVARVTSGAYPYIT